MNSKRTPSPQSLSRSLPPGRSRSIMRIATFDDSIHTTYGCGNSRTSRGCASANDIDQLRLSISFSSLHIREYARQVGDNPSVSGGPPLGLGWEYDPDTIEIPVDEYEASRGPRRTSQEMAMPRSVRIDLLTKEWGATQTQIASAVRDGNRIKNSRRRTVQNLDTNASKVEEKVERFKKGFKRTLFRKKKVSEQYEEWKREAARAMAVINDENEAAAALDEADAEAERAMADIAKENAAAAAARRENVVINEDDAVTSKVWTEGDQPQDAPKKEDVVLPTKMKSGMSRLKGEEMSDMRSAYKQSSGTSTAEVSSSKIVAQSA